MKDLKHYIQLVESKKSKLVQEPLPYSKTSLEPSMSSDTIDYHFGKLARAYVDRFNKGEGDSTFNFNGATLHNLFFPQLKPAKGANKPFGASAELIDSKFDSFDSFKKEVEKTAMSIQGSGWVYMDTFGSLKIIPNHEYNKNMKIALLIDWWEHAWSLDYQSDKQKYLKNIWKIINWSVVNDRLQGK